VACHLGDGGEGERRRVAAAARSMVSRARRSRSSCSLRCATVSASFWKALFICAARSRFSRSIGVSLPLSTACMPATSLSGCYLGFASPDSALSQVLRLDHLLDRSNRQNWRARTLALLGDKICKAVPIIFYFLHSGDFLNRSTLQRRTAHRI
jgi:hypothetical protein